MQQRTKLCALLAGLAGALTGCGATVEAEDGPANVMVAHERGPDGETSYFIDPDAYLTYGEIVRIDEPPAVDAIREAGEIGRTQDAVVFGTGYGNPTDDTEQFCGWGSGTWVRHCIVPRRKTILWSWNMAWSDDYYTAFNNAQAVAHNTAWSVRPFVAGEQANVIFYSTSLSGPYAITITEAEPTNGQVNGKTVYRYTTRPVEVHIDKTRIDDDLTGSSTTRHRKLQHVLCHEIGHAMGLPHNPDGEDSSTCMQAFGLTTVRDYSSKEKARLELFTPGDWDNATLITVE